MIVHDVITECHSCGKRFVLVIDEHLDAFVWEILKGEESICPHCHYVHEAGDRMALYFY